MREWQEPLAHPTVASGVGVQPVSKLDDVVRSEQLEPVEELQDRVAPGLTELNGSAQELRIGVSR